ncbi:S-adenosyl-L-methionine-dependent methyltransferase [Boletus reticuloceps]|uniref:S-adenosyl-L-methionine-dependent methyltransferase n=1 Tax=Boletus reticuloceps TaxID=495285 RepID=A0A8I2YIJ9_9AGAM|nr:S-adenosyl-L-methionine-dependent methyltransferase [Boletus reticuloceps]
MSGEAQLEALLEIINTSARQAITEYKKGGNEVPTLESKTYHPIDFANDTVALKKAVRLLEGACQQLCASLAPPQHTVHNYAMSFEWACVGVVVRAKVADALVKYPKGLHVDELAKLVNLEKGKLARVLRLLATKGCFTEVTPNIFTNNRISLITLSTSNPGALSRMEVEYASQGAVVLYETMTEPEYATSYAPDKAPLIYALEKKGFEGNFFDWVKENPEIHQNYHRAMLGLSDVMGSLSVLHHYPWNEVKTVCDVGASIGTVSLPLAKMHPHLRITDQDLPEVLVQAKDVWAKNAPEVLQNNQVEFIPLNFLEGSPVKGQDVYYLRNIIHDWPDAEAIVIMRNVRSAMAPHSRLLIHDYMLTPASRDLSAESFGADVAPEPLLPNFGNGNNRMYQQDLNMWIVHNAKERMLDDLIALGIANDVLFRSGAGLRLEKVYDLAESAVLEFRVDGTQMDGTHL